MRYSEIPRNDHNHRKYVNKNIMTHIRFMRYTANKYYVQYMCNLNTLIGRRALGFIMK